MSRILKENEEGELLSIETKEISLDKVPSLQNNIIKKILHLLKNSELYPKEIAKKIGVHEQNIYYYIKKLEKAGLIKVSRKESINGSIAVYYTLASKSFYFRLDEFNEIQNSSYKKSSFLEPFILDGKLNSKIIVGSPDPHGPLKARSKDGYFGMDLALFLGTFIEFISESKVSLDTEVTDKVLSENNLIILGGPIVNKVTSMINMKLPIYFDEEKKGIYSTLSKKIYYSDETGLIVKIKSPFNDTKKILLLAGLRNSGTKSSILAFLKHFSELKKGNQFDRSIDARVVEGIDLDSDGVVDEIDFLE